MKIRSAEFIKSATGPDNYPVDGLPEVAFAGRSNVGKSSLINFLLERKNLVRTSSTPGRTQLLNFFNINDEFYLVDLPGYGFAKAPVGVRRSWEKMVRRFLDGRRQLRAVVLLLDIRRDPTDQDLELLDWLEEFQIPTIPVLTKADKIRSSQRPRQMRSILEATGLDEAHFTLCSTLAKLGRDDLWARIESALEDLGE